MDEMPLPPQWETKDVKISEEAESKIKKIYLEASISGSNEAIKKAEELNLNHIGSGTGRLVFAGPILPDRTVVKIAKNQRGYQDNSEEAHIYNNHTGKVQSYLAPVLDKSIGSGDWIIMPKCREADHDTVDMFREFFERKDYNYHSTEMAAPNFGKYSGVPCIIDYAGLFTI